MTRNLTRPFQIRAEAADGQQRAITATIATEAPAEVYDWGSGRIIREVLLMSGHEIAPHIPLLCDHTREIGSMVGDVESVRVEGDSLVALLRFASGAPQADSAWALYSQRHGRQVSVGYRVLASEEIPAGQSRVVGGRTFTATGNMPLRVTTRWRLIELSLVPIGADAGAMTRSFSNFRSEGVTMKSSVLDVIGGEVRAMRFPQFLAAGMRRRGEHVPESEIDAGRTALSSVAGIADLAGLVNQTILGGFRTAPDSTAGWVRVVDLPNFLLSEIAAVTSAPRLEKVGRGTVAPTVSFAVGSQGWRLARFGASFTLDGQDIIDGNAIGIYATALEEVGRAARRLIPDLVYATLLGNAAMADGKTIFHSDRGNAGTAALADTALDAGLAAVGNQVATDEQGDPVHLGLSAAYLTVPPDLLGLGRRLARAMAIGDGDLIVRADSRLGTAGVVDPRNDTIVEGSATNWLLTCPSDQAAGVVIGALGGKVEPTIRHYALTQGEWGAGFDVKLDLACTVVDPKSLYFSTGAGA